MSSEAQVLCLSDLQPGSEKVIEFVVSEEDLEVFAQLSGDRNPLHTDPDFAKTKGFRDKVVYGALLIAKLSQLIGMYLPGRDAILTGLNAAFRAPVHPGDVVQLRARVAHVSQATGAVNLSVHASIGHRTVMSGTAETVIRT